MKKTIKKIGKAFIRLTFEDRGILRQSVLIVDNGYSWLGQLSSAIERIKSYFPKSEISILTFEQRKDNLQKDFPALNYILPSPGLRPKRYQIALQMLKMRKMRFDSIVILSLDVSVLIAALFFLKSKVILYNQWAQWWLLKLRDIREIFKVTYVKKKVKLNFKNLLKRIGLFFVLLQRKDEETLKYRVLVIDNGYASSEQIDCAIQRIKESLPAANISLLALEQRKALKDNFPNLQIIKPGKCIIERYRIARHMLRLRKNSYDYVILLSLDITPIIVSILFKNSKVSLYNQWHQWWLLKPKPIRSYLMAVPQFIYNIIIFVYLLISISWIFLKRSFNIFIFNLSTKRA